MPLSLKKLEINPRSYSIPHPTAAPHLRRAAQVSRSDASLMFPDDSVEIGSQL